MVVNEALLDGLNAAQRECVLHPPHVPLQILAGPGSGKTKVLTTRIAYLILEHSIDPASICAVTFTNKAAQEMKRRLEKIIGQSMTYKLRLGTFHALCALFLRRYGVLVGLGSNFTVCDADESKKLISRLLKPYKEILSARDISLKDSTVLWQISKEKARGRSPEEVMSEIQAKSTKTMAKASNISFSPTSEIDRIVAEIYLDYDKALRQSNSLDFDDLLVFGVKLFTQHDVARNWCHHILVDEFQDTNVTQYELMRSLAIKHCVSTVGDPDQSIYAWRSAEVGNLARMKRDFPGTVQIYLEQNYRSTGSILKASLAVVSQDKTRIQKSLHSSHPSGCKPVLSSHASEHAEASYIAQEIKRLVAQMGGTLNWGDFVVLLRFNALSRSIESSLQKESIPSRVLGGHKFFERLEIKDLLAYLQLVDNPEYLPAFTRAVNVPARGIGEKTISEIELRASKTKTPAIVAVEKIVDCRAPDIKPSVKTKLGGFVRTVRALRKMAEEGTSPPDLIRKLLDLIDYESHLRKTQPDWESRWENVQELITFASEVEIDSPGEDASESTPLRLFLQASMLSSDGDKDDAETSREKVTISTCHSAKGLEWPVVFVPAVEEGTFPFYRTDNVEEERRLLYVACTRAQSLLYLSHASKRKVAAETKSKELSSFVGSVIKEHGSLFGQPPQFTAASRADIASVLGRPSPDEAEVHRRATEFERTRRHDAPVSQNQHPMNNPQPVLATGFSRPQPGSGSTKGIIVRPVIQPKTIPLQPAPTLTAPFTPLTLNGYHKPTTVTQNFTGSSSSYDPGKVVASLPTQSNSTSGVKRRLGLGTGGTGYQSANKKFKPPTIK